MASKGTRCSSQSRLTALIGNAEELPVADLPTRRNILQKMILERMKDSRDVRHIPIMELAVKVEKALRAAWLKVSHRLVINKELEVRRKIFSLWQMLEQVTSDSKKKRKGKVKKMGKEMHEKERKDFVDSLDKLFDISSCHCLILPCTEASCSDDCQKKVHIQCNCPREKKIPAMDLEFIYDQRMKHGVHGKFQIAGVDTIETTRQNKALEREVLEKKRMKDREEKEAKKEKELFSRYMESQREQ